LVALHCQPDALGLRSNDGRYEEECEEDGEETGHGI
jgi:hypothetical protein